MVHVVDLSDHAVVTDSALLDVSTICIISELSNVKPLIFKHYEKDDCLYGSSDCYAVRCSGLR